VFKKNLFYGLIEIQNFYVFISGTGAAKNLKVLNVDLGQTFFFKICMFCTVFYLETKE